jgi:catechol 2,3-dioxygenase-like lactoylglutathione lyase family enzyme
MIFGAHLLVYSEDAAADRAFFRDVFGWDTVDAGNGWLIFALPPTEAAVHPANHSDTDTELYLMSTDLRADMRALESRGVRLSDVEEARWGSVTRFRLPGGAQVGLYQPTHPSPIAPTPA